MATTINPFSLINFYRFFFSVITFIGVSLLFTSCEKDEDPVARTDYWEQMADMGVGKSDYGFCFAANGKGYVGIALFGDGAKHTDFWEYDPASNVWSQKQDFAGGHRINATTFGIGPKGYLIGGFTDQGGTLVADNNVWEYDPASNHWTRKNDFSNGARVNAVSFTIDSKAYIGTGRDESPSNRGPLNDLWEYDPAEDKWTRKADLPGNPRVFAFGFSIASNGYIGGGLHYSSSASGEIPDYTFYEYNPGLDQWSQKSDSPAEADLSFSSNSFSSSTKGYVKGVRSHLWQFDPSINSWSGKADMPADNVLGIGFTIGKYGYMGSLYDKIFYRYTIE